VIDWSAGNEFDQRVIRLTSTTKGGVLSCGHGVCRAASRLPPEGAKMLATFKPSFGGSIFSLSPCWRQVGRIQRLPATAAPFPRRRGLRAWSGIGSNRDRSSAVTTANRRFVNFKRAWRSCWNSSKETPTAVPRRRPALKRSGSCRRRVKRPVCDQCWIIVGRSPELFTLLETGNRCNRSSAAGLSTSSPVTPLGHGSVWS
jgi:hypothetical protein